MRDGHAPRPQAKLEVGAPDDRYEQEADRVANQIIEDSAPAAAPAITPIVPQIQRVCAECEEERLQRSPAPEHAPTPGYEAAVRAVQGSGEPLAPSERAYFEPRFGVDFGGVRVHTGAPADAAAQAVGARAYTLGPDIAFRSGAYRSGSLEGRRLLAHELTHVVQQGYASSSRAQPSTEGGGRLQRQVDSSTSEPVDETPAPPRSPSNLAETGAAETSSAPASQSADAGGMSTSGVGAVCDQREANPTIWFEHNSTKLRQDAGADSTTHLMRLIARVRGHLDLAGTSGLVTLHGYASQEGDEAHNLDLSRRRAERVRQLLIDSGLPASQIVAVERGEDNSLPGLEWNRRVEVCLTPPVTMIDFPPETIIGDPRMHCGPQSLLSRGGCGSGPDFTHHDFPSLSTWDSIKISYTTPLPNWWLRSDMQVELGGLAGSEGLRMVRHFASGTGATLTHDNSSALGGDALASGAFGRTLRGVLSELEHALGVMAAMSNYQCSGLVVRSGSVPQPHFAFADGWRIKAIIGGTQGIEVELVHLVSDPRTRSYFAELRFRICDDFGVDASDLYSPGLIAFWVLQHRRTGHLPFINLLDLSVTRSGSF